LIPAKDAQQSQVVFDTAALGMALAQVMKLSERGKHDELPLPRQVTAMREAEEIGGLGLALPSLLPVLGGEPPELDEASLVRVQLQHSSLQPLPQTEEVSLVDGVEHLDSGTGLEGCPPTLVRTPPTSPDPLPARRSA